MNTDFGMMGEMKENLRDGLIEASLHLVNREFDELASDFVTLGYFSPVITFLSLCHYPFQFLLSVSICPFRLIAVLVQCRIWPRF